MTSHVYGGILCKRNPTLSEIIIGGGCTKRIITLTSILVVLAFSLSSCTNSISKDDEGPSVLDVTPPEIPVEEGLYFLDLSSSPSNASDLMQSELIYLWSLDIEQRLMIMRILTEDEVLILAPIYGRGTPEDTLKIGNEQIRVRVVRNIEVISRVEREIEGFEDLRIGDSVELRIGWQKSYDMMPVGSIMVWGHCVDIEELEQIDRPNQIYWKVQMAGRVEDIAGHTITLIRGKEITDVIVKEDAVIQLMDLGGGLANVNFEEIKRGDEVNVVANFNQDDNNFDGLIIQISARR